MYIYMDFNPMTIAPRTTSVDATVQGMKAYPIWVWIMLGTSVIISIGITIFVLTRTKTSKNVEVSDV